MRGRRQGRRRGAGARGARDNRGDRRRALARAAPGWGTSVRALDSVPPISTACSGRVMERAPLIIVARALVRKCHPYLDLRPWSLAPAEAVCYPVATQANGGGRRRVLKSQNLYKISQFGSGISGSNRRHSAWEADTLPTELIPRVTSVCRFSPEASRVWDASGARPCAAIRRTGRPSPWRPWRARAWGRARSE